MSQIDNAKIPITRENATSSESGFVLFPFLGREIITLSKYFPGPILILCLDLYG